MLGLAGVTAIETRVAGVTLKVTAGELIPLNIAVIEVVPAMSVVASPAEPAVLLIEATAVFEETQVTELVRSCVEESVNTPMAVNCSVLPLATLRAAGVTPMDTSEADVTVRVIVPDMPERVALSVVDPDVTALARPEVLMVAIRGLLELHVTLLDTSCLEPSE
jgi:hypothetical protein